MTKIVIENRLLFGQFDDHAASSTAHSFASLSPPSATPLLDERPIDLGAPSVERGDRLSPTTPKATPSAPTTRRAVPHMPATSAPVAPQPQGRSPPSVGPHDFARGLALRGSAFSVPPHAQRVPAGRGRNAIMQRAAALAPPSGTPAQWEAAAAQRRHDFAEQMRSRLPGRALLPRRARPNEFFTGENARALKESAARLRIPPERLAEVIAHETIGSFSPRKWGGKRGRYMGLIQFGPRERREYGAHDRQSFKEQLGSMERFLLGRGYKPGMGQLDLYSTVLAGRPGLYRARDKNGSVAQHVERMRSIWGPQVKRFLASGSTGASPRAIAGGETPQGPVPPTSTAEKW
ncbi:hypothetical protein [Methylocystis rosea]|uniref:Transglycosylase SLT domain-containing protein n=1 Tax=Methylocystis rosea TaxID=173366 RepID=A0A3G8M4L5_9HYPH|nr:hypothetical protein [Methylocystis rosea]AZG75980.1 hypothetical protein EHO51_04110 [Methylocystis rosea]